MFLDTEAKTTISNFVHSFHACHDLISKHLSQKTWLAMSFHFSIYRPSFRSVWHDGHNKTIEKSELSCDAECFVFFLYDNMELNIHLLPAPRTVCFTWRLFACYASAPEGGRIKRCFSLTSVCLSHTSGLTRKQRGLGRLKLAQR